jgi:LuxR family transcriptional regulator, maltose regulon positive regulatory protein
MDDSDVPQRVGPARRAGRPAFDLVSAKLRHPLLRPGTVRRSALIERLAREDSCPIVSVVAPPGYGKTTLLSQWAERNGQAFAWVSVDEKDHDPKVLLSYVAEALDAVQPVGRRVFEVLSSPGSSVPGAVVPRLGSAFASMTVPVVLALDDVHLLHNREGRAALSVLADHVPGGSRLVLSGRSDPPLRIARLRAEGRILEIGPGDLSLSPEEAALLLRDAGVALGGGEVLALHRRTEGWPVGLYLAALYLREGGYLGSAALSFGGDDRLVSEYVESELLSRISRRRRAFLTRTAVLERMCGPLCEAVLEQPGSGAALAELARANLLLVPLDRQGRWYRYHHLFRDMLLADLRRQEPGLIPALQRRAAGWCLRSGRPEEALEYFIAAGDADAAAGVAEELFLPAYRQGRVVTVRRWFGWLEDQGGIEGHPFAAVLASLLYAVTGRPVEAERWADVVEAGQDADATRPEDPAAEAWAAALRAVLCRRGVKQMRADADEAVRRFAADRTQVPLSWLALGVACVLSGDLDDGDAAFEDAARAAAEVGAAEAFAEALCQRSLVAMTRNDWNKAGDLAGQARDALHRAGIEESYATAVVCAVQARAVLHRGDAAAAHQELISAQRLRPLLTYAIPHFAVQARIELIRVHLGLGDVTGARTVMQEVDEILRRRPDLGTLTGEAHELRDRLSRERGSAARGASALTAAELRLLPLLSTHLPVPEIAAELFLSPHTVRSQAMSLYRKLGASTRSQAVARSRELGLLEGGDRSFIQSEG